MKTTPMLGRRPSIDGEQLRLVDRHDGAWDEWPADLRVRSHPDPARREILPIAGHKNLVGIELSGVDKAAP
jgi:hypothetical protein